MHNSASLKSAMIIRVILPVIFFVIIDAGLSYYFTLRNIEKEYDRWLLDTARSITKDIRIKKNRLIIKSPLADLQFFKDSDIDKTYFKIVSSEQGLLTGDNLVPEYQDQQIDWSQPVYFNDYMNGESVRVISVLSTVTKSSEKIFVHVAKTLHERQQIMADVLLADLLPQCGLVLLTTLFLLTGLRSSLKPLNLLADNISQRSTGDMSPIPEKYVFPEVRMLTDTISHLMSAHEQALATQQRFITNAAHQLRTPLAGLKLQTERALREQDLSGMRPALQQIQHSVDRISHVANQLLVLARTEPLNGDYQFKQIDICELSRQICMDWAPKALQRHMDLCFESAREHLFVAGDEVLLRELLVNLLENALIYGKGNGRISVILSDLPCKRLTVEDDGPGIPETESARVFERFYRIPGSPGTGCGLGLAIVKEIADLHKARLELRRSGTAGGACIDLIFAA